MKPTSYVLSELMPGLGDVDQYETVGGGCISVAWHVRLADGKEVFAKCNAAEFVNNFEAERDGLIALEAVSCDIDEIRVPRPIAVGIAGGHAWLVSEWIDASGRASDFFDRFGRGLALLHRASPGTAISAC